MGRADGTGKDENESLSGSRMVAMWLLVGLTVGVGFGLVLNSLITGLLIGLVFGSAMAIGARFGHQRTENERERGARDEGGPGEDRSAR